MLEGVWGAALGDFKFSWVLKGIPPRNNRRFAQNAHGLSVGNKKKTLKEEIAIASVATEDREPTEGRRKHP